MKTGICIWAHSKCRSTFGLYREVMRQAGVPVRIVLWQGALELRTEQGFGEDEFADVPCEVVGENRAAAARVLDETVGWVQVVCAYQVWKVGRMVMRSAHARGDRVVVFSEAPCEMCVGVKAWAKRMYYRWVLPWKMRGVVKCADLMLNESGSMGMEWLERMGWRREQIVPFGYSCEGLGGSDDQVGGGRLKVEGGGVGDGQVGGGRLALRVLHLGMEDEYRGVRVLEKATRGGARFEVRRTGGKLPLGEVVKAIEWADVVVGCGLCEPWGMRINDAVMSGRPVVVSDGMGVARMVEATGCGLVVPRGDAGALRKALVRCAEDREFLARLRSWAKQAAEAWAPVARAREFVRLVAGGGEERE